eukprot:gene5193-18418_t
MVTWALRWFPPTKPPPHSLDSLHESANHLQGNVTNASCASYGSHQPLGSAVVEDHKAVHVWISLWLVPLAIYVLWSGFYYLKIFVFSASTIKKRGYKTLFEWVVSQKKGVFYEDTVYGQSPVLHWKHRS